MRPGVLRINPESLVSLGCAPWIVAFIRGRSVHWDVPLGYYSSSGVAGIIGVRSRGHCVHPRSLGSTVRVVRFVGFIRGRWVHRGAP